ncbi:hypothetical protein [Brachybacterium phenoliresistens]|uniref:hypothetical protein n=1 Tax=Brachybacterium phenoliresistens TaxID=396014 RepID=UPI0012EBB4BF|nr:hypothetical protein [Brachybacterium phenoliresistens]
MLYEVDGERFEVEERSPGNYAYRWVSHRDPQYGFSVAVSGGGAMTPSGHREHIREFISLVDPVTGYIED